MPGLGALDPADLEAQARAELGFSRRLKQPRRILPCPGFGGAAAILCGIVIGGDGDGGNPHQKLTAR